MHADLSPIIDLAILYNPNFAYADFSVPRRWVEDGCDIEADILPAMKQAMDRKRDIKSFLYFTAAVMKARDGRKILESRKPREVVVVEGNEAEMKAKRIAWLRRVLPHRFECDAALRAWMHLYEQHHGRVEA